MREKPYLRLVPLEEEEEPAEIGGEVPAKDLAVISAALCAAGLRGGFEENGRTLYTPTKVNAISVGN